MEQIEERVEKQRKKCRARKIKLQIHKKFTEKRVDIRTCGVYNSTIAKRKEREYMTWKINSSAAHGKGDVDDLIFGSDSKGNSQQPVQIHSER